MGKPILCVDFDGVLHRYDSKWSGADVISDGPVPGAMQWLDRARQHFRLAVYSSRSKEPGGIEAMQLWLRRHLIDYFATQREPSDDVKVSDALFAEVVFREIEFPTQKPPAFLTIDDRCMLFEGVFPDPEFLLSFKPWNKRDG